MCHVHCVRLSLLAFRWQCSHSMVTGYRMKRVLCNMRKSKVYLVYVPIMKGIHSFESTECHQNTQNPGSTAMLLGGRTYHVCWLQSRDWGTVQHHGPWTSVNGSKATATMRQHTRHAVAGSCATSALVSDNSSFLFLPYSSTAGCGASDAMPWPAMACLGLPACLAIIHPSLGVHAAHASAIHAALSSELIHHRVARPHSA